MAKKKSAKTSKQQTKQTQNQTQMKGVNMQIIIPEDQGGTLKQLSGTCRGTVQKISMGSSKTNQPKCTFKYTITDDSGLALEDGDSAIGDDVLETFSLQPQAIFSLSDTWKQVTGDKIPLGNYTKEEFQKLLEETFIGTEWDLFLALEVPGDGSSAEERTVVKKKTFVG